MRVLWLLVLAAGMVPAAAGVSPADEKSDKEKKLMLPDLKAKEWKKLDSGLEVWDVKEGKGDAVKAGAKVKVHYTGWLTDGKVFDSSVERGRPIEFPLTGVIKGWQEGIPGMKPGGVRRLKIPANLGYGDRGFPPDIPGGATLVFEVELLEIK
jgi:FKBP-type peptidyl-prolyl cis-trans isomerase